MEHSFADSLSEKAKIEDNEVSIIEMNSKLETALTAKQESEAKVLTMEEKIKLYESELNNLKEKVLLRFLSESRHEKTCIQGFRPGPTQTGVYIATENG